MLLPLAKRFSRHPEELATKDLPGFRRTFTHVQNDLLFLTEGLDPWPSPIHERGGQIAWLDGYGLFSPAITFEVGLLS